MVAHGGKENGRPRLSLARRLKWLGVMVAIAVAGSLVGGEIYFRLRGTYLVMRRSDDVNRQGWITADPDQLAYFSPAGKRFLPNVHVTIKNHQLSGRDVQIDTNSLGFRDDPLPLRTDPGELRVLVLGDSITLGDYLPAEEVYVKRAQHYLRQAFPRRRILVINGGIGDVGLADEVGILAEKQAAVSPDVVVIEFYVNDSRPPWGFPQEVKGFGWIRRHSVLARVSYQQLVLRRWIRERGELREPWAGPLDKLKWKTDPADFRQLTDVFKYDWGATWRDDAWPGLDQQWARLAALSAQGGFKVVVVAFPVSFQVSADFVDDKPQQLAAQRARQYGFFFLDLLPLLRAQHRDDLFFDWCHPRDFTNDFIGRELAWFLAGQVLAPKAPPPP